jgi:hypothetical protein
MWAAKYASRFSLISRQEELRNLSSFGEDVGFHFCLGSTARHMTAI